MSVEGQPAVIVPATAQTPKAIIPDEIRNESTVSTIGPLSSSTAGAPTTTRRGRCDARRWGISGGLPDAIYGQRTQRAGVAECAWQGRDLMQAAVGPRFSLSDPCCQRVPVVAFSFCLDHGLISLSERRSRRGILSPAIVLRPEGKAERIFDCFPIRLDGGMIFSEIVAGSGSVGQTALRRSEDETTRNRKSSVAFSSLKRGRRRHDRF
jgi:hypothetical protein